MTRHDEDFQRLFDVANKVLEAVYEDEQAARRVIDALDRMHFNVAKRLNDLSSDVTTAIEDSASQTADKAAQLLTQKFAQADACADQAAERYRRAANKLNWKLFGFVLLIQLAVLGGGWLLAQRAIPSQDEIKGLRALVGQLSQQAAERRNEVADLDRQVANQKRKLADLERRGSRVEWSTCQDEEQRSRLCFRTDERAMQGPDGERTYRVPWGY
ncbi:hypothetical protein Q3O98_11340 [Ralstonia pseudosolanacearum]|uniref:hypothetical protein n=1 Tax=Ralstonia pseudosolanacearum TaxID=1310165 RepID=UPI0026751DD4|nr:hypothetical protein [Ralstonia pseudosolanacearum]MDO3617330.1 hypothetical protein [Ralstonia pseudosolanacearum]MDO3621692.1 hypothetical protein [Ralstonia pseudosolanacearum]